MKIGIISDTHKKFKKAKRAIDALLADGVEFLIHAGDVVELETLEYIESTNLRYVVVYGNNDHHLLEHHERFNLVYEPHHFKLAGVTFKLMHIPQYMAGDAEVVIFGHTHRAVVEQNGDKLFINSGEVCARDTGISSWAMLEVSESEFMLRSYTRASKSEIKTKEERFARRKYE